jgi:hypothetical protein
MRYHSRLGRRTAYAAERSITLSTLEKIILKEAIVTSEANANMNGAVMMRREVNSQFTTEKRR